YRISIQLPLIAARAVRLELNVAAGAESRGPTRRNRRRRGRRIDSHDGWVRRLAVTAERVQDRRIATRGRGDIVLRVCADNRNVVLVPLDAGRLVGLQCHAAAAIAKGCWPVWGNDGLRGRRVLYHVSSRLSRSASICC